MSERANVKRVPLSLTISHHARQALNARAMAEGHRYPAALAASLLERAIVAPPAPEPASTYDARLTLTEREAYGVASALIPIPGLASRIVAELTTRGASRERCAAILDALGLDMPPAPAQAGGRAVNSGGAL